MMGTGFDLLCLRRWHGIDATSYACEATLSVGSPLREQSEHLFRLPIFSRRIHHNLLKLRVGGHSTPNHLFQQTIHSVQSSSFSPPSLISRHRANMAESVVHSPFLEVGISSNSFSAPKTMPSSESLPIRFSQRTVWCLTCGRHQLPLRVSPPPPLWSTLSPWCRRSRCSSCEQKSCSQKAHQPPRSFHASRGACRNWTAFL